MRDIFRKTPNFDFLGKKKIFFTFSLILIGISFYVWFSKGTAKYGIDFLGGHEIVVELAQPASVESVRAALATHGIEGASVKNYRSEKVRFSIRVQGVPGDLTGKDNVDDGGDTGGDDIKRSESSRVQTAVKEALKEAGQTEITVVSAEFIGPTVGAELRTKALIATILGNLGILIYLAFRFELAFGVGAVVALVHDVIFSIGVYLLFGYTINMETLAAALTIVGYSVNDTIVIFDRVREEIFEERPGTLSEIVNRSINAMLSRTLVTHMLTTLSIIALLVFGSGAIEDMSVFLLAGMVSGSYSTMYIAAPVMIWWHKLSGGTENVT
jgi:preprotein translocase subunit SecF